MVRRKNDFYPTPEFATRVLLDRHAMLGLSVFECCVGDGAISRILSERFKDEVWTNDIADVGAQHFQRDAGDESAWRNWWNGEYDWVITNPPFNRAAEIVPLAYEYARFGIAMLLRLSFLEPVEDRGAWLNEHPPSTLIVLPRISFTGNGKTDSVTCAWMVWEKNQTRQRIIVAENPKFTKQARLTTDLPVVSEASQRLEQFGTGIMTADIGPLP